MYDRKGRILNMDILKKLEVIFRDVFDDEDIVNFNNEK